MVLTDNEKWQTVLECNETFDGQFYYGVKTTGIFCRPSCKSKPPLRKNVIFFDTLENAYVSGLRPCKRCRPDRLSYHPTSELLEQAKNIYDTCFADEVQLSLQIKQLHCSQNHLIRLFRHQLNMTPTKYLQKLRIQKATQLLTDPTINVLDVAILSGFGSMSNFYACFKKQFGLAPGEYRLLSKNQ